MKNLGKLENNLDKCLYNFSKEIEFNYETFEQNRHGSYCNKDDMRELAKQTFYMLDEFKDCIIKYLRED